MRHVARAPWDMLRGVFIWAGDAWYVLASHAKMGSRCTSEVGLHMG